MAGTNNAKSKTRKAQAAVKRQRALELRVAGLTCTQIGHELGVDVSTAAKYVRDALAAVAEQTQASAEELRAMELERLDKLIRATERILASFHLTVNNRGVVEYKGEPVKDDGPALAAVTRLQSLYESRRKLLGLDAPTKLAGADGESPIKVVIGVDPDAA